MDMNRGNKRIITFKDQEHEIFYRNCLQKCRQQDVYHKALVYCLGISSDTRRNIERIFDFKKGMGKIEIKLQFSPCLNINNRSKTAPHNMREKAKFWWRSGRDSNPRPPA